MPSKRFRAATVFSCFFFGTILAFRAVAAELPSESMLPGSSKALPDLPVESVLPTLFALSAHTGPSPSDVAAAERVSVAILPAENQLPGASESSSVGVNDDAPPLDLENSVDQRPWLRLDLGGSIARVRALTFTPDSRRLCAAGDDKDVMIWSLDQRGQWVFERAIRWQVQRGPRGRIYALCAVPNLLAIGGHGAMGSLGEILLVDPTDGNLRAPLVDHKVGHRQRLTSLAFSPDAEALSLASMDMHGTLMHWRQNPQTGLWAGQQLANDEANGLRIRFWRTLHPIAMPDASHVVAPFFVRQVDNGGCLWKLQEYDVISGDKRIIGREDAFHRGMVTAMAAATNGKQMASADDTGQLFFWDRGRPTPPVIYSQSSPVTALAFSSDGTTMLAGYFARNAENGSILQIWDVANPSSPQRTNEIRVSGTVLACGLSPDGKYLAYSQGGAVVVRTLSQPNRIDNELRTPLNPALRVAFPVDRPWYRLGFASRVDNDRKAVIDSGFDTSSVQPLSQKQVSDVRWLATDWMQKGWKIEPDSRQFPPQFWLTQDGQRKARLPLEADYHGRPVATCWVPDRKGRPFAVAVGTNGNNNIYLFRLKEAGVCEVIRQFRGHSASVMSLAISRDLKYLASSSRDGTVRIWPVGALDKLDAPMNRWGASFGIDDGSVLVSAIREDGPLYFRGVRQGDIIRELSLPGYVDGNNQLIKMRQAKQIQTELSRSEWDKLTAFHNVRGRAPERVFQSFPAWQPLVSLFVAKSREWAYWSPSGFYDSSFEGHKLFGWQVNRGLELLPDFFLAAQMRRFLEQPRIMSRLLDAGSMDAACRQLGAFPQPDWSSTLANLNTLRPRINILSPHPHRPVNGDTVHVRATIDFSLGTELASAKAFANGVVGINRKLVSAHQFVDHHRLEYEWTMKLPSDREIRIQVSAATDSEIVGQQHVKIRRKNIRPNGDARLFVVTAGVNKYRDAQVPPLDYAVNNAVSVARVLRNGPQSLYQTRTVTMLDDNVTRPSWSVTMQQYADELRQRVMPDDLLVIFLSGHGVRDDQADRYYYVTSDADLADIRSQQYADCLSFEDFTLFADIPCRKLVVLDTCHSGAVQPLRQRELKSALRALQDDLIFTLTASEGSQEAIEDRQRRLGLFTHRFLEALSGAADGQTADADGIVDLAEVIRYVKNTVAADSATQQAAQFPTAGPIELLDLIEIPLTKARQRVSVINNQSDGPNGL